MLLTACSQETSIVKKTTPLIDASCAQKTFCAENPDKCDASCQPCAENPESECQKGDAPCSCKDKSIEAQSAETENCSLGSDQQCENCQNESCENKKNPGSRCGCNK